VPYKISVSGLKGGHSGGEINRGRGNSNKLMGRILHGLSQDINYFINEINGGLKMNAIPREAEAVILINPADYEKLERVIDEYRRVLKNEFRVSDPGLAIKVEKLGCNVKRVFSSDTMSKAIAVMILTPSGVQTMSMDIEGLVESSTNLGVVTTVESEVTFESAVRSSVRSLKYNIVNQLRMICDVLEIKFSTVADYPEWEYAPNSKLRDLFNRIYNEKFGKDLKIKLVHGGLECGLFKEKMPDADMVSFGPDMYDIHTPNEHISIPSIARTWDYLLIVLKELK
jgi:dipeptidase D